MDRVEGNKLASQSMKNEWVNVKKMVDEEIKKIAEEIIFPEDLKSAAFHLINAGGKRIRPFMLMLSAATFGVPYKVSLPAAVSIELLHNFTLIHDDIMDKDEYRRGVPTTHVTYGEPMAILAGDFLFSHLHKYLIEKYLELGVSRDVIINVILALSEAMDNICYGQTMDLMPKKYIKTIDDYLRMVYYKTASLIEVSTYIGAILGTNEPDKINKLRTYGKNIGIAFQIADDILGIYGDTKVTGKPVGNDIRMGKHTILVMMALNKMSEEEKKIFLNIFGNMSATDDQIKIAIDILNKYNVRREATKIMENLASEAIKALRGLPDNKYKQYLEELSYFIIYREK